LPCAEAEAEDEDEEEEEEDEEEEDDDEEEEDEEEGGIVTSPAGPAGTEGRERSSPFRYSCRYRVGLTGGSQR